MAKLLNLKVGDTITVQNSQDESVKIKIAGITEMYMGHFLFMNASYYQKAFGTPSVNNANLVTLAEPTKQNVENMAAKFINLPNVYGVVQNNNLKLQISTMVNSLTQVIGILITVSILLAVVVLHNLTNINVSERIPTNFQPLRFLVSTITKYPSTSIVKPFTFQSSVSS